jgi:hypothetical protein
MSEATVTFVDGVIIDIYSNTLIQIFYNENSGGRIQFSGGGINVNTGTSDTVISSGDKDLTVRAGSAVRLASDANKSMNIAVSEGTSSLEGETISAGSGLFLSEAGEILSVPQAVAISPHGGARILTQTEEGALIDFTWNKINYSPNTLSRLEIARDRNFNRIYFSENSSESRLGIVLPPGTWYWRLYPVTTAQVSTRAAAQMAYSRLVVAHNPIPVLISPPENQEIVYNSSSPSVRFIWTTSPEAASYNLEAADNPSMQNPVLNLSVNSAAAGRQLSVLSSALKEGTWYWRVTPVYSRDFEGSSVPSAVHSFIVKQESAPVVPAHEVESKTLQKEVALRISKRRETGNLRNEPDDTTTAEPPPLDTDITPEIAATPAIRPPVITPEVTEPPVVIPEIVTPPVTPPVVVQDTDTPEITELPDYTLLPVPQNIYPADLHTVTAEQIRASRDLSFSWNEVQGANGYVLTVSRKNGNELTTVMTTQVLSKASYTIEDIRLLGRGSFLWHVEAVNVMEDGSVEHHGQLVENRLIIDIPEPRQIRTVDLGTLYGN